MAFRGLQAETTTFTGYGGDQGEAYCARPFGEAQAFMPAWHTSIQKPGL